MNKLISNRWFQYAMPFVIWFLLLVLPFLPGTSNNLPEKDRHHILYNIITANILLLLLFYLHTFLVYPLLNHKNKLWYILVLIAVLALYWYGRYFLWETNPYRNHFPQHLPNGPHPPQPDHEGGRRPYRGGGWAWGFGGGPNNFFPILSPLVALLCSFCYRVIVDNQIRQQMLKEKETIQLKSELTFLRSQISPHFMFNILNNLVSLARKKSDDLEPAIVNLSQLMRYMLYESDDHRVILSKEIEYLRSFVNLQLLRFGNTVKVNINVEGDIDMYTIEPMLLIPFVENAFKHGTGMIESPVIDISLAIDDANRLMRFKVVNAISPLDASKDNSSGIGIANVQRRLAILYPGKHELHILNEHNLFTIDLSIYLTN